MRRACVHVACFAKHPPGAFAARLLLVLLGTAGGCAVRVTPPANLADPVRVFIADYGRHASLILPRNGTTLVEFAYGEWGWFALGRQGWYRAIPAIAMPTPGTLGMRNLHIAPDPTELAAALPCEQVCTLRVERAAAGRLRGRLDAAFARYADRAVYNRDLNMHFVPYPLPYCLFCQCNSVLAQWLRELGCRVRGTALLADFRVEQPAATHDHKTTSQPAAPVR